MKGHHLRDVLPPLPEKPLKQFTDHTDLAFIQDRCFKLERFLINMNSIPHVASMVCMKAFLGIMDQVGVLFCLDGCICFYFCWEIISFLSFSIAKVFSPNPFFSFDYI